MTSSNQTQTPTAEDLQEAHGFLDAMEQLVLGNGGLAPVYGLSPEEVDAMAEQADILLEANRLKDAETLYESCVLLEPTDATYLCRLGTVRALGGDWDRAALCFTFARQVSHDPAIVDRYVKDAFGAEVKA